MTNLALSIFSIITKKHTALLRLIRSRVRISSTLPQNELDPIVHILVVNGIGLFIVHAMPLISGFLESSGEFPTLE